MSQNYYNNFNPAQYQQVIPQNIQQGTTIPYNSNFSQIPQQALGANAVSINIYSPQAYGTNPINQQQNASLYGENTGNLPIYPMNYNNMMNNYNPQNSTISANSMAQNPQIPQAPQIQKEAQMPIEKNDKKDEKKTETKTKIPLTNDYIKTLENYLNDSNPKVRLLGAKELIQRFKEDDNRKDNPCLIPLLNKSLRDPNSAVRFLGLTALQCGYSVGNDETIQILKEIQANTKDKLGEDQLLASEILLKLSGGQAVEYEAEVKNPKKDDNEQKTQSQSTNSTQNIEQGDNAK